MNILVMNASPKGERIGEFDVYPNKPHPSGRHGNLYRVVPKMLSEEAGEREGKLIKNF